MEVEWNTTVHKETEWRIIRNPSPNVSIKFEHIVQPSDENNSSTPLWVDDIGILHKKIQEILYEVMKKHLIKKYAPDTDVGESVRLESVSAIVEKLSQKEEWVIAFTHESTNANVNNSYFLYEGSELINYIFARYLVTRFGTVMNTHKCTTLTQHNMSNMNLMNIATTMNIDSYVHHNVQSKRIRDNIVILKSFFACLHQVGETYTDLSGYQWCLMLMQWLFDDVDFDVDMDLNYRTQLKEIYDKRGWKQPKFSCVQVQEGDKNPWLVQIISGKRIMGVGKAILKVDARSFAAMEALITLDNDDRLREQQIVQQQQMQSQQSQQSPQIQQQNHQNQLPMHKKIEKIKNIQRHQGKDKNKKEKSSGWQKTKENKKIESDTTSTKVPQEQTGQIDKFANSTRSPLNLYVIKRNNYGNPQLSETPINQAEQIEISSLKSDEYWAIKEPSDRIRNIMSELHAGASIYQCNSVNFLISPIASLFYKPENSGYGSGIVIEFIDDNAEKWFLLISDDKHYVANVQGCSEGKETYEECIKREVLEETAINLKHITPIPIARYGFVYKNALVDCEYEVKSEMFFVQLQYSNVSHLFPNGLKSNQINIVDVVGISVPLDEVKYIIAIPASMNMNDVPEKFEEIQISKNIKGNLMQIPVEYPKKSHHRQFIDLFKTNDPIVKPPYLNTLTFDVRYEEALEKFNDINGEKKSDLWFFFQRRFESTPIKCKPSNAVRHNNIHTLIFDYPDAPYKLTLIIDLNLTNQDKIPFSYTVENDSWKEGNGIGSVKAEMHGDLMKGEDRELLVSYLLKL